MKKQAGFTLMEILIVVIIVGILASVALPQYFKSLERSRSSQVLLLLSHIAQAQERKYFQINKFVTNFRSLDVTFPGASETIFYTLLQEPEGTLQLGRFYYTLDLYPVSQMWLASNPGEGDEPPGTPIPGLLLPVFPGKKGPERPDGMIPAIHYNTSILLSGIMLRTRRPVPAKMQEGPSCVPICAE